MWLLIQVNSLYIKRKTSQETVNRMKEKTALTVHRAVAQSLELNKQHQESKQLGKMAVLRDELQVANKHVKICSRFPGIRESSTKYTLRVYHTLVKLAFLKKTSHSPITACGRNERGPWGHESWRPGSASQKPGSGSCTSPGQLRGADPVVRSVLKLVLKVWEWEELDPPLSLISHTVAEWARERCPAPLLLPVAGGRAGLLWEGAVHKNRRCVPAPH